MSFAAFDGTRRVPVAVNEPVRTYAPNSPETKNLKLRLDRMAAEQVEIPIVIGGRRIHTGDIGTVDDDGYLYLVDRAKDLIIVSGFNVFPAEVEEVLAEHPGVAEVGVVGVPHPHHGEAVKAFVVPEPDTHLDEDQLIEWCSDHLARYKCPSKILFVDELPRNVSGKLLRRSLV
jgi:acyl-CoA synthetase (AMP-forming)/AMP-acid ligase II